MSEQDFLKTQLFGKLTASATHEFQNVLAIIKESAGLMEDVLTLTPMENAELLEQRLGIPLSTIKKQVTRGVDLVSCLNGFAHSTDHARHKVDVQVLVKRLVSLSRRLAANTGVELAFKEEQPVLYLDTDAVQFQVCLYYALEALFLALPARSLITLTLIRGTSSLSAVILSASHLDQPIPGDLSQLICQGDSWEVLQKAGQAIQVRPEANDTGVTLFMDYLK
ncbi:MAG: hypothetical protein QM498_02540 [Desulfobacterium sp.]